MKYFFSTITAIVIMLLGWLFLAVLLSVVGYVGVRAGGENNSFSFTYLLIASVLSPLFGGVLATCITPGIYKTVPAIFIKTTFITAIITISVLLLSVYVLIIPNALSKWKDVLLYLLQVIAAVVGGKFGFMYHVHRMISRG